MTKRLNILKNSLEKKENLLNDKINNLYADVRQANGQPMNDKRNGHATMKRWDNKEQAIYNQINEINKTKEAIEKEESKIAYVEAIKQELPQCIINYIESGKITQWRKYPNRFFVPNGGRSRLIWDDKTSKLTYLYKKSSKEECEVFRSVAIELNKALKNQ